MSAAKSAPKTGEVVGEILLIDPALIDADAEDRIGQFFPLKAEGLACRIKADGQLEPILIAKAGNRAKMPWRLIAGRHRLAACLSLGRNVEARVVAGDKTQLRKKQAIENLDRRRMTVLEESMFVAAVAAIAQARVTADHGDVSQQQLAGMARSARSNLSRADTVRTDGAVRFAHPGLTVDEIADADADADAALAGLAITYGWRDEVCDAVGMSLSALKRSLRIHRQLVVPFPDLMDALKEHPIADNASALLGLATTDKAGREAKLRELIEGAEDEAPQKAPADPAMKLYDSTFRKLVKMEDRQHDALIEARINHLRIDSKRRIYDALHAELKKGGE